jgi:alkylresorcinol/alkylpyrone synthase
MASSGRHDYLIAACKRHRINPTLLVLFRGGMLTQTVSMAPQPVSLLSLATACPPHCIEQSIIAQFACSIYSRALASQPKLADVFHNAGIEQRYSVQPLQWFLEPRGWPDRTKAYLEGAGALFVSAARRALDGARMSTRDVDVIVTISSTGITTPSLEAHVSAELGFKPSALRVPVFGRGCGGGVAGLAIGARLARAQPGEVVLVVAVETNTLAFRGDRGSKADVISSALFGDGAAACVLRREPEREGTSAIQIGASAEHTWPNTLDIMGWSVDPVGLGVVLSRSLPRFLKQRLAAPVRRFVKSAGLSAPQLVCHPGGTKVLEAMETALELQKGTLRDEREVLRSHGNMSSSTALFVLDRAVTRGLRGEALLMALGPGFTASFLSLGAAHG